MLRTTSGKFDELVNDFADVGIDLVMPDYELVLPESSALLSENAYTKAKAAAEQTGMVSLGDDSGVFIEALSYFPGVHSRRWLGEDLDDELRNEKILEMMENEDNRKAFLMSCFSVVDPSGTELAKERVNNEYTIAYEPCGSNGFGYDRILVPSNSMWVYASANNKYFALDPNECYGKTVASLTQPQKNMITFRGRIAESISKKLKDTSTENYGGD